jgi:hypothetical protein
LEDLPEVAAVAAAGRLSDDQLTQVVKVAEPADDPRWAGAAPSWSAADLAQRARVKHPPTARRNPNQHCDRTHVRL